MIAGQINKADRNACHGLCRTERTEQSEFTNEMSNRVHESTQVTNKRKSRATLRRLISIVLSTIIMQEIIYGRSH
jgi:hypothetical protein